MPCYFPLDAGLSDFLVDGKHQLVFKKSNRAGFSHVRISCGQCIGCRLQRSLRWAVRLIHENKLHQQSSFLTLTYSPEYVPSNGSLNVVDVQLFLKRLRKKMPKLRYFQCGEYGEEKSRPHHHMILFGTDFSSDRIRIENSRSGGLQYMSPTLSKAWGLGRATISEVNFETVAYVARYCLKKVTGPRAEAHYQGRRPEFVTMSRRPGIGSGYAKQWLSDFYSSDSIIIRGKEVLPPPFYDKLLEKVDPSLFASVKAERAKAGKQALLDPENRRSRLRVRAACAKAKLTKRGVE